MKKMTKKIIALMMMIATLISMTINVNAAPTTGSITIKEAEGVVYDGVTFEIYKVADDETSTAFPTDATVLATKQTATVADDADNVKFENLALGRYLVVETAGTSNSKVANFLVDIPTTQVGVDGASDTLVYDVEVSPKQNTTYGKVTLTVTGKSNGSTAAMSGAEFNLEQKTGDTWTVVNESILSTDTDGTIVVDGLTVGEYRFVQVSSPSGYILDNSVTYDFSVSYGEDGETLVTVGENEAVAEANIAVTLEKPTLSKVLTSTVTNNSVKIGDTVSYKVTAEIPSTIAELKTFKVTDTFPTGLTYDETSLVVKADTTTLDSTVYNATYADGVLTIDFTDKASLTGYEKIEITYSAVVNENAPADSTGMVNSALLGYSTVVNQDNDGSDNTETKSESKAEVTIYTGGLWIEKRAQSKTGDLLSGAVFKIATSKDNAEAGIYLSDADGEITLTTDSNGKVSYKGLALGTYYLVEVKAPTYVEDGETKSYNLLKEPVEINVTKDTYTSTTPTAVIINKKGFTLPAAGSIGTIILVLIGIVIIALGKNIIKNDNKR